MQTTNIWYLRVRPGSGSRISRFRDGDISPYVFLFKTIHLGPFRAPASPGPIWAVSGPPPGRSLGTARSGDQPDQDDDVVTMMMMTAIMMATMMITIMMMMIINDDDDNHDEDHDDDDQDDDDDYDDIDNDLDHDDDDDDDDDCRR